MVSQEQFEELRVKLATYEAQQELSQTRMQAEVKEQVSEVTAGLKELYNTASVAVGLVASRVDKLDENQQRRKSEELVAPQKYDR